MKINCPHSYISSQYNLLVSKKHSFKNIKYSSTNFNIVKVLYRSGVISNFLIQSNRTIKLTAFFYKNSPFFKKINLISTKSKSFFIKHQSLKIVQKLLKASIIILSTRLGLVTGKEALQLGLGGKIIFLIN